MARDIAFVTADLSSRSSVMIIAWPATEATV